MLSSTCCSLARLEKPQDIYVLDQPLAVPSTLSHGSPLTDGKDSNCGFPPPLPITPRALPALSHIDEVFAPGDINSPKSRMWPPHLGTKSRHDPNSTLAMPGTELACTGKKRKASSSFDTADPSSERYRHLAKCEVPGCTRFSRGKTRLCMRHGGGRRCLAVGCTKAAIAGSDRCAEHVTQRKCAVEGCNRKALGTRSDMCYAHRFNGFCQVAGCNKVARGGSNLCHKHGICSYPGCKKRVVSTRSSLCPEHGGVGICKIHKCYRIVDRDLKFCCNTHRHFENMIALRLTNSPHYEDHEYSSKEHQPLLQLELPETSEL